MEMSLPVATRLTVPEATLTKMKKTPEIRKVAALVEPVPFRIADGDPVGFDIAVKEIGSN
jgi:hypothetical protein